MKSFLKGFTLIELLMVIAIIAVTSGVVIAVISPERQRAKIRDASRQKDLQVVATALEQFYADNNRYPAVSGNQTQAYSNLRNSLEPAYLKTFPVDPSTGFAYCYASANSNNFVLCASLETDTTDSVAADGTSCTATLNDASHGRYCVSNPL